MTIINSFFHFRFSLRNDRYAVIVMSPPPQQYYEYCFSLYFWCESWSYLSSGKLHDPHVLLSSIANKYYYKKCLLLFPLYTTAAGALLDSSNSRSRSASNEFVEFQNVYYCGCLGCYVRSTADWNYYTHSQTRVPSGGGCRPTFSTTTKVWAPADGGGL